MLYKYTTLFVVVFSAAIILPLPINMLLIAMGAFSSQGYFSLTLSFVVAVVANVIGDTLVYLVMRKYAHEVLRQKYIKKYSFFLRLEHYIAHHTRMTVFLSRLIGVLGPPVNFLAGFMKIRFRTFVLFDFLGNMCEIGIFLFVGYLIGDTWNDISSLVSLIQGLALGIVIIFVLLHVFKKRED